MSIVTILRDFLDGLEEGVLFLDAGRRVIDMNRAAARTLGWHEKLVLDQLCPSLFPGTACARECERSGRCSLTPKLSEDGKIQDIVVATRDGRSIPVRMWAMLLPPNDGGLFCAIILRDRSHEIELEGRIRDRWQLGDLIGRGPAMQELYRQVLRAASSDANVLVTGESGVGKELVARALHDNAARNEGPFVSVHCAALPETLLESELFGHAKGAFSGASATRIGRFEAANGGTLLLDEIGEVPLATQVKLLRVLQEREVVRIGENQPRAVDVRVIAATNRDLGEMVRLGQFREDLYYRLYVLPLRVPALRERREDISLLATKLLDALAERYRRPRLRVSAAAIDALERCDWPGNVRQLFNALEYAVVQCDGTMIDVGHLPTEIVSAPGQPVPAVAHEGATRYWRKPATDDAERTMILDMLEQTGGNKAEAARRLGMSRTTLWKRLRNEI